VTAEHPLVDAQMPTVPGTLAGPFEAAYDDATDTFYALVQDSSTSPPRTWFLATIDVDSGEIDPIGSGFVIQNAGADAALAPADGILWFSGKATSVGNQKVFGVSTTTGALVASPDLTSGIAELSFNPDFLLWDATQQQLFGLFGSGSSPRTRHLLAIDTATGALTQVGDTFVDTFVNSGRGAFDEDAGIWYVQLRTTTNDPQTLYGLDVEAPSGTVVSSPATSVADADFRDYPDYVQFVPEPAPGLATAVALGAVALLRRRRRGRPR